MNVKAIVVELVYREWRFSFVRIWSVFFNNFSENSPQSHEVKKPDSEAELFEYKDGLEGKAVKNKSKIKDPEAVTHERVQSKTNQLLNQIDMYPIVPDLGFDSNESFIDVASLTSHSPDFDIKKILPDSKLKEDKEEIPSNKELQTYRPLITTNLSVKEKTSLKDDSVNPITSENTHFDESTSSSVENIRPPAIKDDNSSDNGNLDCDKTVMWSYKKVIKIKLKKFSMFI